MELAFLIRALPRDSIFRLWTYPTHGGVLLAFSLQRRQGLKGSAWEFPIEELSVSKLDINKTYFARSAKF